MYAIPLNLNPGTTRHVVESVEPIKFEPSKTRHLVWVLTLTADGLVKHPEHSTIKLPPGEYRVEAMQEYDPFTDAMRAVFD